MFRISTDTSMLDKLRGMLEDEEEGTCVRLREYKVGGGCHAKIMLGLGMDEPDEDDDVRMDIDGVPFVAEKDFLSKYGTSFTLGFNDNKEVLLLPAKDEI